MNLYNDYVLYEEEQSQSGPSFVSSSFCPGHGRSRWDCGCAGTIYTPNTSPPVTYDDIRQPNSYPTTDVSQEFGYEDGFLDLDMAAESDEPEPEPQQLSASTHHSVAVPFAPYDPLHGMTPTIRQERIEQALEAVPPALENPNLYHGNQYREVPEALQSTTPTTSPPEVLVGIGTHFHADTNAETAIELACLQCRRPCKDERELKRHMRWHDEGKKKKCDFCSYTYFKPTDYQRHMKTHMPKAEKESQSFPCWFRCGTTFTRKDNIWRHFNTKHNMTEGAARQFVKTHY